MNFGDVNIFVSKVSDGNMSYLWGDKEEVDRNRMKFFYEIGIDQNDCVYTSLVHGINVIMVGEKDKTKKVEADGFVTLDQNLGIFMLTGDCLPVVFSDNTKQITGIAHMGWRGVDQELGSIMVEKFIELGSIPKDINVWIGPGARKESYWKYDHGVPEFLNSIDQNKWKNFLEEKPEKQLALDLVGYTKFQVISKGVSDKNIIVDSGDTIADKNYYSQFRSDKTGEPQGRFATVVIRKFPK